jgi:asparagine synthase (glutamine-hydrolysing)
MFAFGLWDEQAQELFLARDRFGIKPLYYFAHSDRLLFASEAKALLAHREVPREVDWSAVCDYLVYRYVPSPKSIWKGLAKLPPASWLRLGRDGAVTVREYWTLPPGDRQLPFDDAASAVDAHLESAVRRHLESDVALVRFLSAADFRRWSSTSTGSATAPRPSWSVSRTGRGGTATPNWWRSGSASSTTAGCSSREPELVHRLA